MNAANQTFGSVNAGTMSCGGLGVYDSLSSRSEAASIRIQATGAVLGAVLLVRPIDVYARPVDASNGKVQEANVSRHLGIVGRVNLGSFYTPAKYVRQVATWLIESGIDGGWTVADLSCGYGAFFELSQVDELNRATYIGNDIDEVAIRKAQELFPKVAFTTKNALANVSRANFGIAEEAKLVIVGNPPYNDVTSQINQKIKTTDLPIDKDLKTRDFGISSLLAYDKLEADYVAVLHPLSYLIKQANFKAARKFFGNYKLVNHIIFSSQEFAGTSKLAGFPVVVGFYKRDAGNGLNYSDVSNMVFRTVEGDSFSLNGFDYVTDHVAKYPGKKHYEPEILFYTMRDINALMRSRTFIKERIANSVDVDSEKLPYYCYIDCFKRYAKVPYYMGNFNVPFIANEFDTVKDAVVAVAKYNNPDVLGETPQPSEEEFSKVKSYITKSIKGRDARNAN